MTGADLLVRRLKDYGVRTVFGYPGGPLTPLYDALYREPAVRHVLARDEQGAGFMADGHARVTGQPGVCIAVCGPGAFNASTAIGNAFSDSIPVLLINGQVPSRDPRSGYYHENNQLAAFTTFTKAQLRVERAEQLVPELDRAWATMLSGRQGPVLFEVTAAALAGDVAAEMPPRPAPPEPLLPRADDVQALTRLIAGWQRPLLMVGGGVISSGAEKEVLQLAVRLGAPTFHTLMGKCVLPAEHPLNAGMPWKESTSDATDMASRMSPLFAEADGMIAIGCRFTQVITGSWALRPPASLAQIDIDPGEIGRHYPVKVGVVADARLTVQALIGTLPSTPRTPWTGPLMPPPARHLGGMDLVSALRRALPRNAIVVADVTRLGYMLLTHFPVHAPRTLLHPAAAISMGYGLPAAIGAKLAAPDRPVLAVMGDGCFQMTGMEFGSAVQAKAPIVVLLVNDGNLTLIKLIQQRRFAERFIGVDLWNPNFELFANAFDLGYWCVSSEEGVVQAVSEAVAANRPALVEVRVNG